MFGYPEGIAGAAIIGAGQRNAADGVVDGPRETILQDARRVNGTGGSFCGERRGWRLGGREIGQARWWCDRRRSSNWGFLLARRLDRVEQGSNTGTGGSTGGCNGSESRFRHGDRGGGKGGGP